MTAAFTASSGTRWPGRPRHTPGVDAGRRFASAERPSAHPYSSGKCPGNVRDLRHMRTGSDWRIFVVSPTDIPGMSQGFRRVDIESDRASDRVCGDRWSNRSAACRNRRPWKLGGYQPRACGQIEYVPGNGVFVLNHHQFGRLGPPLWIRRSGLGPRTLLPWELVAVSSGLNTFSSRPSEAWLGLDGCPRHQVGAAVFRMGWRLWGCLWGSNSNWSYTLPVKPARVRWSKTKRGRPRKQ